MASVHTFHIPVMGIGFTVDTPLKVSHLGIDSAISLVDDMLLEKLRRMYCSMFGMPYQEIETSETDCRAKRITSYLNMVQEVSEAKFNQIKSMNTVGMTDLKHYFSLLPSTSQLKKQWSELMSNTLHLDKAKAFIASHLRQGDIDVNIMTKVDKENFKDKQQLPVIYNDAHAALRGFALSNLRSSLILSAGLNPSLFSYIETFQDFYPNETGDIKKRIILKVSDYRSALIQGKILAKKGLWVSEFRIESGLNCGGHAFATNGLLMGPILATFSEQRSDLQNELNALLREALIAKKRCVPKQKLEFKVTAQGGVGTHEEHAFLLDHYRLSSVGWGSPFLLVPEATTVDDDTLNRLTKATTEDLYLSNISPLGVPFNSLRGNTKDIEKQKFIDKNRPGSACPKKYVALNKEFSEEGLCTASRQYQYLKLKALDEQQLAPETYKKAFDAITEKSCTCVGLGTSALLKYNLDTKIEGQGVSVCPGPNMAYFSKVMSLQAITNHIYGEHHVGITEDRPNMFVKELRIYIDYISKALKAIEVMANKKEQRYYQTFIDNLKSSVIYYQELFGGLKTYFQTTKTTVLNNLDFEWKRLEYLNQLISEKGLANGVSEPR